MESPPRDLPQPRDRVPRAVWLPWGLLIGAGLVCRVVLLCTSQRVADGDESIVGLMALRILEHGEHPLFFQGQNYDLGAGIVAHVAALIFRFAGVSDVALKSAALLAWATVPLAVGFVAARHFGHRAAFIAVALVTLAPTCVEWATKARGGHMLGTSATVLLLGLCLEAFAALRRGRLQPGLPVCAGLCAGVAVWLHPSTLPAVSVALAGLLLLLIVERRAAACLALLAVLGAALIPLAFVPTSQAWSWQHFAGAGVHHEWGRLVGATLPGLFTPDLDGSIPPAAPWVRGVGWLWLAGWGSASVLLLLLVRRSRPADRRDLLLLVATAAGGAGAMLMVDSSYANSRVLIPAWPLACLVIAVAAARFTTARSATTAMAAVLALSGLAVHVSAVGPADIHGAGHQQRLPGDMIERILADLDRHRVECVFSESAILQWNIMFESHERIAARWFSPEDRWQRQVDRVNQAFLDGRTCALLMRVKEDSSLSPEITRIVARDRTRLTGLTYPYALLYGPPPDLIRAEFPRKGGWPATASSASP